MSNSKEYKKAKGVNKNVVAKVSLNEYKDVLLNKNCSMNRIQSKNHRLGTYEINKISFFALVTKFIFLIMELLFNFWLLELIIICWIWDTINN